jgi:hypothetical protein
VELDPQVESDPRIYYKLARIGSNLRPIRIGSRVDGCSLDSLALGQEHRRKFEKYLGTMTNGIRKLRG